MLRWLRPQLAFVIAGASGASAFWLRPASMVASLIACAVAAGAVVLGASWTMARIRRLRELEITAGVLADWTVERESFERTRLQPTEFGVLENRLEELAARLSEQIKDAARKSRNLEALIDALDEPVLATDNDDKVLLCNRSAESILGEEPGGLIGRPFADLFTQADIVDMHGAARTGETRRGRAKLVTPLGTRTMQVSAAPVPVAWGDGIFGAVIVLRDVTELAYAVQVKTDFVANASHELRTPVAAIRGAAETLEEVSRDNPAMTERLVRMILSHTQRLEEMLRDLLDLSRLESAEVPVRSELINLAEVARSLHAQFDHACAPRGLSIEFDLDDDLHGMRTDPGMLNLVLRNFIENAVKFASDHTTIQVRASLMEEMIGARAPAKPGTTPDGKRGIARFEVEDRGIGIPLQHQDRVFERYYQVDSARTNHIGIKRGTGLGLAIVKHAAKAMGGRVGLQSVWGEGTRIWAEWPVELERG